MTPLRLIIFLSGLVAWSSVLADWSSLEPSTYPVTIETSGTVVSKTKQMFTPPAGFQWNRTISYLAKEGQHVRQGDLLITFEGTNEDERLRQTTRELELKTAELEALIEKHTQEIEKEKLDLADAKSKADKARRKAEQPVNLVPSLEYRKLVEQREMAELLVEQLSKREGLSKQARDASRRALETSISRLQHRRNSVLEEISGLTIHAPREGLVVVGTNFQGQKIDVGEMVQASSVVLELVDGSEFRVQADVAESQAANLKLGQFVRMKSEGSIDSEFTGTIHTLGSTVRRKSRRSLEMVREFIIELDEPNENLKLGMPVMVVVEVDIKKNAIAIPIESVIYREGIPGVITQSEWQRVTLGERSNGKVIIESGLSAESMVQL